MINSPWRLLVLTPLASLLIASASMASDCSAIIKLPATMINADYAPVIDSCISTNFCSQSGDPHCAATLSYYGTIANFYAQKGTIQTPAGSAAFNANPMPPSVNTEANYAENPPSPPKTQNNANSSDSDNIYKNIKF